MILELHRKYLPEITTGEMTVGDLTLYTVELPWKDNIRRKSCIPEGRYKVVRHTSPKFGKCFWIKGVPERSEILIHPANYVSQLLGCIAPGVDQSDINKDGVIDNVSSRDAMSFLLQFPITELLITS